MDIREERKRIVHLDSGTFRRLDVLARTKAGAPIEVMEPEDMGPFFACGGFQTVFTKINEKITRSFSSFAFAHEHDHRVETWDPVTVIRLVNQIEVEQFRAAEKPELDYAFIPDELIFDFVVWHEIGHIRIRPGLIDITYACNGWPQKSTKQERLMGKLVLERKADRYAWRRLFQKAPYPIKGFSNGCPSIQELDEFEKSHKGFFRWSYRKRKPISTDPCEVVPKGNVRLMRVMPWDS